MDTRLQVTRKRSPRGDACDGKLQNGLLIPASSNPFLQYSIFPTSLSCPPMSILLDSFHRRYPRIAAIYSVAVLIQSTLGNFALCSLEFCHTGKWNCRTWKSVRLNPIKWLKPMRHLDGEVDNLSLSMLMRCRGARKHS